MVGIFGGNFDGFSGFQTRKLKKKIQLENYNYRNANIII